MSQLFVKTSTLKGDVVIPASKSHTHRAILFGALGKGTSLIRNYLISPDSLTMIEACRLLGAKLKVMPDRIEIEGLNGCIQTVEDVINAGNSGIVLRFCTAVGALGKDPVVVTGDHSIRHRRPMKPLLHGLSQLGVRVESMRGDDSAPVIVRGPIRPGCAEVDGEDSQPVSALLIAAAFSEGRTELRVRNPGEKPWVALTLDWFDRLGIPYSNHGFEHYAISGGYCYDGFEYEVPGDFSTAAFPIAAALVTGSELVLKNIDTNDSQGDKELIHVLQKMGALIEIDQEKKTLHVRTGGRLSGISVDINNFVDAITILAVVACFAEGETHILNAAVARSKECDRISAIASELRKMGADIIESDDGLIIRQSPLRGACLESHNDHRMVMSLAVAAMGAEGASTIDAVECVRKTYPAFVQDFQTLGAGIRWEI